MRSARLDPRNESRVDLVVQHIETQGGEPWVKNKSLLEVGGGSAKIAATLMRRYRRAGLSAHVVEPSDEFLSLYRWYGIKKVSDTFEQLVEFRSYLMILAAHWLEHVVDINQTMAKVSRLLHPNGMIFLEVPNCDADYWQYRLWPNPPHLHFFTTASLRRLMEKFGFRVITQCRK
jgi:2-polyprenyl-3-methyl-5-hydroxy-6-metoxy-1,4-benzoquinol methylase